MAGGPVVSPNSEPQASDTVIHAVWVPGQRQRLGFVPILLAAWLISAVVHAVLLSLFLFVTVNVSNADVAMETHIVNTQIEDEKPKEANLENEELGLDPNELLNYSNK